MSRAALRVLVWKEWREQRSVMLVGILVALVLPLFLLAGSAAFGYTTHLAAALEATEIVLVIGIWPLFSTRSASFSPTAPDGYA